ALRHCESRTVTSHGLRHTFAFLLHKEGKPLRVIQEVLGHADPKTTAIYAHVASLWAENPANDLSLSLDC
ncbi:MAG: tyrosine-type recombinase/integrase, partial [Prochloraceae cyanobacterium]